MNTLRASLAGVGAYYLLAALVLTLLGPVRYSLPVYGTVSNDPMLTILAVVTFIGVTAGALVAYASGGWRAFAVIAALQVAAAAWAILPLLAQRALWTLPPDIVGLTPAMTLLLSHLMAVPALLLGFVLGARVGRRGPPAVLQGAGAYYLSAVAISLPTPQLDLRLTLPFTADSLPDVWHVATTAIPALVAAVVLSDRVGQPKATALVALFALAGAAPAEVSRLAAIPSPYLPVSLVTVPALSAGIAAAVGMARSLRARRRIPVAAPSRPLAAAGGAAAALIAVATWAVFASMPSPYDRVGPVETYMRTGDERKVVLCVMSGRGEEVLGASAREDPKNVTVAVRLRRSPGYYFHDLVGIPLPVIVTLRDPLVGRTLTDQWSGRAVSEVDRAAPGRVGYWC